MDSTRFSNLGDLTIANTPYRTHDQMWGISHIKIKGIAKTPTPLNREISPLDTGVRFAQLAALY